MKKDLFLEYFPCNNYFGAFEKMLVVSVARKCVTALYKDYCWRTDLHLCILSLQWANMIIQSDLWYSFPSSF